MSGKWIDIATDGRPFRGYLAVPGGGSGPGIVLLQEIFGVNDHIREVADLYAEEGYTVLAPDLFWRIEPGISLGYDEAAIANAMDCYRRFDAAGSVPDMAEALAVLRARPECTGKAGALGFCLGGNLAYRMAANTDIDCAVCYYGVGIETLLGEAAKVRCPIVFHFAGKDHLVSPEARAAIQKAFEGRGNAEFFLYPDSDHAFNSPSRPSYDASAALMAHTRSLTLFRRVMGPVYDLSALWERHTELEFAARDADATMTTMVAQPYVNHIPTMTGGFGYADLLRFYKYHFIPTTPPDCKMTAISRTIGVDRLVDEFIFSFTHTNEIDWLLPGVPPTGKFVEIPMLAVVRFRGSKLYNEHIFWDQATVLVQVGLLDPAHLPVAGAATARKLLDPSLPSNTMMRRWSESAAKAAE